MCHDNFTVEELLQETVKSEEKLQDILSNMLILHIQASNSCSGEKKSHMPVNSFTALFKCFFGGGLRAASFKIILIPLIEYYYFIFLQLYYCKNSNTAKPVFIKT